MPITVSGPDGAEIEFPDDTAPDTIKSVMAKRYGAPKAAEPVQEGPSPKEQFDEAVARKDYKAAKAIMDANPSERGPSAADNFVKGVDRLAGTQFSGSKQPGVRPEELLDVGENFVRSVAAPLGGDYIAGATADLVNTLEGDERTGAAGQRARREELKAANPITATAGELLGAGGVGKILAPAGGGVVAQGAATGAVTGANMSGGDPVEAALGAAGGAVAGKAFKLVGEAVDPMAALAKRLKGPDGKPLKPQELYQTFKEFEAANGVKPSMAQLAEAQSVKALTKLAENRKGAKRVFDQAADDMSASRPGEMQAAIVDGKNVTGAAERVAQRDDAFTAAMDPIRDKGGLIRPTEAQILLHPDVVNRLDDAARAKLQTSIQNNKPAFLTVNDLDTVRRTLGQAANAAKRDGANYGPLQRARATARLIGERVSPKDTNGRSIYRDALADYEGRSDAARGALTGQGITTASTGDLMDASRRLTSDGASGAAAGARKVLSEAAGSTKGGAIRTARNLTEPGMQQKVQATMGQSEAQRLAAIGRTQAKAADNMAAITQRDTDEIIDATDAKKIGSLVTTALMKTKSPGVISAGVEAIAKPLSRLGLAPGVAKKIAELATAPGGAERIHDYLSRARVGQTAIEKISKAIGIPLGTVVATE